MRARLVWLVYVTYTALLPACKADPCASDDYQCITDHLHIFAMNGEEIAFSSTPTSAIKTPPSHNGTSCGSAIECCSGICTDNICGGTASCTGDGETCTQASACCSGSCTDGVCDPEKCAAGQGTAAPTISLGHATPTLTFSSRTDYVEATLQFSDSCGATPGGCFPIVRARGPLPAPLWSIPTPPPTVLTTPPVTDGMTSGTWSFQIGYDFEPSVAAKFTMDIYAYSDCNGLRLSTPLSVDVEVDPMSSSDGSSCPDGHPCDMSGGHVCCPNGDGSYSCLLSGLCQ